MIFWLLVSGPVVNTSWRWMCVTKVVCLLMAVKQEERDWGTGITLKDTLSGSYFYHLDHIICSFRSLAK